MTQEQQRVGHLATASHPVKFSTAPTPTMTRIIKKDRSGVFVGLKINSTTEGSFQEIKRPKGFANVLKITTRIPHAGA